MGGRHAAFSITELESMTVRNSKKAGFLSYGEVMLVLLKGLSRYARSIVRRRICKNASTLGSTSGRSLRGFSSAGKIIEIQCQSTAEFDIVNIRSAE